MKKIDLSKVKKALVINPFGIGDVLFTTPLIKSLKLSLGCEIAFLSNSRTAPILRHNPNIYRVFVYERDEWSARWQTSKVKYFSEFLKFISQIRAERFDMALDLSLSGQYSFFSWLAGIKVRCGFNYKKRANFLNYSVPLQEFTQKHVVEYYLDMLKSMGLESFSRQLEVFLTQEELLWADNYLSQAGISGQDLIVGLSPAGGASWGKDAKLKHWGAGRFAAVADKLVEKHQAKIIICGSQNELAICNEVLSQMKQSAVNVCGKTDLIQLAAILDKCKLVIANDGGPLHIAVALGKKTVSIFGPVDDVVYGPYPGYGHKVIKKDLDCRPCYRHFRLPHCAYDRRCLTDITADEVLAAAESLLKDK